MAISPQVIITIAVWRMIKQVFAWHVVLYIYIYMLILISSNRRATVWLVPQVLTNRNWRSHWFLPPLSMVVRNILINTYLYITKGPILGDQMLRIDTVCQNNFAYLHSIDIVIQLNEHGLNNQFCSLTIFSSTVIDITSIYI